MKMLKVIALVIGLSFSAIAKEEAARPALRGYDAVTYHTNGRPAMGNGNHVSVYKGQQYLFINEGNKRTFDKNPRKYAPAFGGWCAFGVSVGKKFHADPLVWEIVGGQLYVNLDNKIKGLWLKDVPGNIKKANENWKGIRSKPMASL